ncbi:hypothetical protein ACNS7O_15205 (plasmid) [Haloferacaceae archaeon DSL9]
MDYPAAGWYDAKATGLIAWMTMTVVGTLIRVGWVRPLATPTRGWVTLQPSLLLLRVGYFNVVLATATFGGLAIIDIGWWPPSGLFLASGAGALGILAFPRIAEEVAARRES